MGRQYRVSLTKDEVDQLNAVCRKGRTGAKVVLYARALLLMDKGEFTQDHWKLDAVAKAVGLSTRTLNHLKERFVTQGLEQALQRKKQEQPSRKVIFDGAIEAKVTEMACSTPPDGYKRWTVRLLADKLVEMKIVDSVSHMTIHRMLKKTKSSLT